MSYEDLTKGLKSKMYRGLDVFWQTEFLRTEIPSVDSILGGGFGRGRLCEIFGNWSSGKTVILYKALASNQRCKSKTGKKGISFLCESEGGYDPEFFAKMGGDPKELVVFDAVTVEQVFDDMRGICTNAYKTGDDTPVCIGWDSIAATGTKHLDTEGAGGSRDMTKSFAMDQGTKLLLPRAKRANVCIIATNQTRDVIGSKDSATHTPGGRSYPFAASQRLELRFDGGSSTALIWDDADSETRMKIGRWTKVEVVKNKLGPPFRKCSLPFYTEEDMDHPVFNERRTKLGYDIEEGLFSFYRNNNCHGVRVIECPTKGWFTINNAVARQVGYPVGEKFRKGNWPMVLERYSKLMTFVYDGLKKENGSTGGNGT